MSAEKIYACYKRGEIGIARMLNLLYEEKQANPEFKLTVEIYQIIVDFINDYDKNSIEWSLLTQSEDYCMKLFKTRSMPYYNVNDPRWQEINIGVKYGKEQTPLKIDGIIEKIQKSSTTKPSTTKEESEETAEEIKEPLEETEETTEEPAEETKHRTPKKKRIVKKSSAKSKTVVESSLKTTVKKGKITTKSTTKTVAIVEPKPKAKTVELKQAEVNTGRENAAPGEKKELSIAELYDNNDGKILNKKDEYAIEKKLLEKPANNGRAVAVISPNAVPKLDIIIRNLNLFFDFGMKAESLLFAMKLMYNYRTCHIIFEPSFWQFIARTNAHSQMLRYCLQYANYILRHEETIMMSEAHVKNRIVTTLSKAYSLPSIYANSIEMNPYIVHITGGDSLSRCIPFYLVGERKLCNLAEFKERFRIATNGVFEGIDFSKFGACVSGSILVPCVHKSPLEKNFKTFQQYLEYYYPGNESLIENNQPEETFGYNLLTDVDIAIRSEKIEDYEKHAIELIEEIKKLAGDIQVKTTENHRRMKKFNLSGGKLNRPVEIFHIFNSTHIKMVKKFHLPLVRMYYDGQDVTMLRSCISALMSGVCEAYKWFSSNKIAADVMLKYAQRGISIILNEQERTIVQEYIKSNGRWKTLPTDKWFGVCSLNHVFFYPDQWAGGIRYGLKNITIDIAKNQIKPTKAFNVNPKPNFILKMGNTLVYDTLKIYVPDVPMLSSYCRSLFDKSGKATLDDMFNECSLDDMNETNRQIQTENYEISKDNLEEQKQAAKKESNNDEVKYQMKEQMKGNIKQEMTMDGVSVKRLGLVRQTTAPEINNEWSDASDDSETYFTITDSVQYDD